MAGETTEEKKNDRQEEKGEYGRMMIRNHFFLFRVGKVHRYQLQLVRTA